MPPWLDLLRWASRVVRILLGILLILGGMLGFLPILGFWMLPLGLVVLAKEIPAVDRLARRARLRWHSWRSDHG